MQDKASTVEASFGAIRFLYLAYLNRVSVAPIKLSVVGAYPAEVNVD